MKSVKLPGFFRALAWLAANVNCLRSEFREAKEESEDDSDSEEEEEDEACRLQHSVINMDVPYTLYNCHVNGEDDPLKKSCRALHKSIEHLNIS